MSILLSLWATYTEEVPENGNKSTLVSTRPRYVSAWYLIEANQSEFLQVIMACFINQWRQVPID